jgi:L-fuconolactonase
VPCTTSRCASRPGSRWFNRDKLKYCIEQFGPDRCTFESNFPVDKVSYSYNVVYNAFKRLSTGYSAAERAAMFHDTAARVYRIAV